MIAVRRTPPTRRQPGRPQRPRSYQPRLEMLEPRLVLFKSWLTLQPNHEMITAAALPFLRKDVLAEISIQHAVQELVQFFNSAAHFDNCNFHQAASRINDLYAKAVRAADPNHFNGAAVATYFGELLHPVQDFYSHSNWVDLGQTTLIDAGDDRPWDPLDAYSIHDGAMILQGRNPEPFGPGSLERDGFVVTVHTPAGDYRGVLTGTWGFANDCPSSVAVPHGSILSPHGLNKDGPSVYNGALYPAAADLAVAQTMNEFNRLVNLVQARYGTAQRLLDAWIRPGVPAGARYEPGKFPTIDQAVPAISKADFPRLLRQELGRAGYAVPAPLLDALTSEDDALHEQVLELLHGDHAPALTTPDGGGDAAADAQLARIAVSPSFTGRGLTSLAGLDGHAFHTFTGSANPAAADFAGMAYGHGPGTGPAISGMLHDTGGMAHEYLANPPPQAVDHKPG